MTWPKWQQSRMDRRIHRQRTPRLLGLDWLRGIAILLMFLDHAIVVARVEGASWADSPGWLVVRLTVTRIALPLFCLVSGSLVQADRPPNWRRLGVVGVAGIAASFLGHSVGLQQPDILLVLGGALAVAPYAARGPGAVARFWPLVVAVLQPVTWPFPWGGYQPGTVLALVIIGHHIGAHRLAAVSPRRFAWQAKSRWVFPLGQHPLTAYLGHLGLLYVVAVLLHNP